jgi:4-hydroxybenzoate polyprenyltransferase
MAFVRLMRPQQWVKNVFVFAGLIFAHRLNDPVAVWLTLLGFGCLCLVSSAVYIVNDIHDREEDRLHPRKCKRPIASGEVSVAAAAVLGLACLAVGLAGGWRLGTGFGGICSAYFVLQLFYTLALKHMVILDVLAIGLGFVLRAVSGAVLIGVQISHWLVICTFVLCLFMGFSKRRCELNAMAEGGQAAGKHRRTLDLYTPDLLNHMTTLTAGLTLVCFMLYTVDKRTIEAFGNMYLLYTVPLVVYAIFRYTLLVEHGLVDGPTEVVLKDRSFQAAILAWLLAALGIIYFGDVMGALAGPISGPPPGG